MIDRGTAEPIAGAFVGAIETGEHGQKPVVGVERTPLYGGGGDPDREARDDG